MARNIKKDKRMVVIDEKNYSFSDIIFETILFKNKIFVFDFYDIFLKIYDKTILKNFINYS